MTVPVEPFSLSLARPLRTAAGVIDEREGFLVRPPAGVDDASARRGVGEASPLPGWTESRDDCAAALRDATIPDDASPLDAITVPPAGAVRDARDADPIVDPVGGLGATERPAARHGLVLALGDAAAREADVPFAALLAEWANVADPADTVPVNATVGDGSVEATVRDAERAVDDGFDAVKVKIGARDVDADVDRLRAVRRAIGPAIELRADANGAWSRSTARRALDRLRDVDPAYVEQPLPAADLDGLARLRAESPVPVAADEAIAEHGPGAVLRADAADAVVLKPMVLGGPDAALLAARAARDAGVDPVITTTIDGVVARVGAIHVAAAVPNVEACGLATASLLAEDLAPDPAPVEDGAVDVPTAPGLAGEEFNEIRRDAGEDRR